MPWQAHLFIGERVIDQTDVRRILTTLQHPDASLSDDDLDASVEDRTDFETPFTLTYKGRQFSLPATLYIEGEAGGDPLPRKARFRDENSFALFGIQITSRYKGTLLDLGTPHGRPDPFVLDLAALADLLRQVRERWPAAEILMMDVFH